MALPWMAACAQPDAPAPEDVESAPPTSASSPKAAEVEEPTEDEGSSPDADPADADAAAPAGMVLVPAGIYLMGSPEGGSFEERPMHEVIVPAIYFDRTEVTVGAYRKCVEAGQCEAPRTNNPFCNAHFDDHDDHPVNCIAWGDADAYCKFVGKRLPAEREWEYAARGGAERRTFSWGHEPANSSIACYSHSGTCKVASFDAGAFGLHDMSGNVWEWTSSWYGPYPTEMEKGLFKVYRGGSWSRRFPKWLRNELRNRYRVQRSSAALGMRCVKTKEPLECPDEAEPREGRCVRVRGTTLCEPGYAFDGKACTLDLHGKAPAAAPAAGSTGDVDATPEAESSEGADVAPQYVRSRTPAHDGDCKRNWPGTPAAYRWDGGTFHSRNPVIARAGCVKRDMGRTWTSACCAR